MHAGSFRTKRGRYRGRGADRAVITVVLLAVTFVLLLTGFSGPSVSFALPDATGWVYVGIVLAAAVLAWLFYFDEKQKRSAAGSRAIKRGPKHPRLR